MNLRQQFVLVTFAKFAVAGLNVIFVYLCSRRLADGQAAAYFAQYSAIMLVATICGLGAGVSAFSIVSPAHNRGGHIARVYTALLLLGLAGIAAAGALYALAVALGLLSPVNPGATGLFLVAAAVTLLLADLNRSAGDIALSILLQGSAPVLILLGALAVLDIRTADDLMTWTAVAFSAAAAAMLLTGSRHLAPVTVSEVVGKAWAAIRAAPFPVVSNMQMHAEIVLGSLFLGPSTLPVFVLANRTATLVKMPSLIAFRVFAPSMNDRLATQLSSQDGDWAFGWRMLGAGALLLAAGSAALVGAQHFGIVQLPTGFFAVFAVCAGIKLIGLILGSPESLLVATGRFAPLYVSTLGTFVAIAGACYVVSATAAGHELLIVGLVSSWFVFQRLVMWWMNR